MRYDGERDWARQVEQVKSLRELALEFIRDAIVSGRFAPGQHLKERELAEAMGISTTPVKEALRVLEHIGLVQTVPRRGTYVSPAVNTSLREINWMRAYLESLAARWAAEKATGDQLAQMEAQLREMERLTHHPDRERLAAANTRFHELVREAAGNAVLASTLSQVAAVDRAFRRRALQDDKEVSAGFEEHRKVFEAIRARDPDLAEARMRSHILRAVHHVLTDSKEGEDPSE
ncbi:MAG: GntR family transcriptional regulator [Alicyclobacillus macrosporangiidus]|uniref:GntR family transcriptional regulator n=1 Tax=Alicyclobacillus macrosporangiidus TaxID=392015 RepID=UPI0026F1BB78|nr:GntR family transcriptional regulator [Alicyclobacillus macrosporangiidus]MCL6598181.1 GntR family transcriptional regulator [Alicyclobacillus macrosporangiidus]